MVEVISSYNDETGEVEYFIQDGNSYYSLADWAAIKETVQLKEKLSSYDDYHKLAEFYSWLRAEVIERLKPLGFTKDYPQDIRKEDLKPTINKVLTDVSDFVLKQYGYYYYPREFQPHKDKDDYRLPKHIEEKSHNEQLMAGLGRVYVHPSIVRFSQAWEERERKEQQLAKLEMESKKKSKEELGKDGALEIVEKFRSKSQTNKG
jgi:hypothetical protein